MKINKRSLTVLATLALVLGMSLAPKNLQASYYPRYNRGGFLNSYRTYFVFMVSRFIAPNPPCDCRG